jgi:hypothetical protein
MTQKADLRHSCRGELAVLAIASSVILASAVITPSTADLSFFGVEIPVMCTWRRLIGVGCPGCGLTRSFAFMAHGHVADALAMNKLGPLLFVLVAVQVPYRLIRVVRGPRLALEETGPRA